MERRQINQIGGEGRLPAAAPLANPYVPFQMENPPKYEARKGIVRGTLFPGLDLPFKAAIQANSKLSNTALVELMALDFAIHELGLYLTTHADDQDALQLYRSHVKLGREGREKYQKLYGPLLKTDITMQDGFDWLKDPWPWEIGGND